MSNTEQSNKRDKTNTTNHSNRDNEPGRKRSNLLTIAAILITLCGGSAAYFGGQTENAQPPQEPQTVAESTNWSEEEEQKVTEDLEQAQEATEEAAQEAEQTLEQQIDQELDQIEAEQVSYTFRNSKLLNEHYEKHGKEMGFASAEDYEKAASAVVTNPDALHKIEEEDGDDVYYLEETNEFVIVSVDGYIRTYYNPRDGINYFNRQ